MPVTGKVIPLSEIGDGVFSTGILGKGVGIIPTEGTVYAPFDGEVILIADTRQNKQERVFINNCGDCHKFRQI